MAMSKKDYELIAGVLERFGNQHAMTTREKGMFCRLAVSLSNQFKGSYPMHDQYKFLQACKLPKVEGFNC